MAILVGGLSKIIIIIYTGNKDIKVKIDDRSRVSSSECAQQRDSLRRNASLSYDNVDNISYGCVLDEDGDTTGEGVYDTISEEDDNSYYMEIIP